MNDRRRSRRIGWSIGLVAAMAAALGQAAITTVDESETTKPRSGGPSMSSAPASTFRDGQPAGRRSTTGEPRRSFVGVILSDEAVDVGAPFAGVVATVSVRLGQRVEAGQVLARLDAAAIVQNAEVSRALLQAAQAELEKSKVALDQASEELARRQRMPSAVSAEELQAHRFKERTARAALQHQRASVAEQRARLGLLLQQRSRAVVRAPFAGVIALRYVDRGATVAAGTPLVRLLGTASVRVRFAVPPDRARDFVDGRRIQLTLRDRSLRLYGKVTHAGEELDAGSGMLFFEGIVQTSSVAAGQRRATLPPSGAVCDVQLARQAAGSAAPSSHEAGRRAGR